MPRKRGVSRLPQQAAGETAAFRPEHQRRVHRRRRLLRQASDSQARLQVTADRAASKHFGDTCTRGKGGTLSRRSRRLC